ncbi:Retrovirus-related Pol polyprotein from transposon [Dictyocoela roeselum]|nr:Retrovirus-related Pol polyprotein from transposon [Dictyocoela roeselum]
MLFGLTNAPFIFQIAHSRIMQDLLNHTYTLMTYQWPQKYTNHTMQCKKSLKRLSDNQVSINCEKLEFGKPEVSIMDHIINQDETQTEITKIETLKYKRFKTKKHLEKILGLINWF